MKDLEINLLSGCVELIEGKAKRLVHFDWALVKGDTPEEIRRNFRFSETFAGRKVMEMRKRAQELEEKGCVRLVSFEIKKQLGRSCIYHTT